MEARLGALVDTDILIDAGRGLAEAVFTLQALDERYALAVSIVTTMELVVGCRSKAELQALESFLARFHVAALSEPISHMALELLRRYRLSNGLLIADALIAATALCLEQPLCTKNRRDYRFIHGLELLAYPLRTG